MKKPSQKLIAIRIVKGKLEKVNVSDVANELKCTRQNIYYHLNEEKAEAVSLTHLAKISEAIDVVIAAKEKAEKKQLASLK